MNRETAALALHPMHQALLANHKEFHVGAMKVFHMTGTQGSYVLLGLIGLVLFGVFLAIVRS